jgi:hypothetical protein
MSPLLPAMTYFAACMTIPRRVILVILRLKNLLNGIFGGLDLALMFVNMSKDAPFVSR